MGFIQTLRANYQQPPSGALLDPRHPLFKNCTFALNFNDPYRDAVTGKFIKAVREGTVDVTTGGEGHGQSLITPDDGWMRYPINQDWAGNNTIITLCRASMPSSYSGVFSKNTSGTSTQVGVGRNAATSTIYYGTNNTVVSVLSSSSITDFSDYKVVAFTHSGATSATISYYINGVLKDSVAASGAQLTGTGDLLLGCARDANTTYDSDAAWSAFLRFDKILTAEEIAEYATFKNIWRFFAPQSQRIWTSTATGTTFTITPSGSIVFTGTSPITSLNNFTITPDGGVIFSGANALTFESGATEYIITPSGGLIFSGSNQVISQNNYSITPDGGITLSGTNTITGFTPDSFTLTPSGGIVFSGDNTFVVTKIMDVSEGIVFEGTNAITSNTVTVSTRLPLTGVGK